MAEPLSPERLAKIRERSRAAIGHEPNCYCCEADPELLWATAWDVPDLLAEVERLQGEVEEWRSARRHSRTAEVAANTERNRLKARIDAALALHQQYRPVHRDDTDICTECSQYPVDIPYPCPTVRALRGDE